MTAAPRIVVAMLLSCLGSAALAADASTVSDAVGDHVLACAGRGGVVRRVPAPGEWETGSGLCLPGLGGAVQSGLAWLPAAPGPDRVGRIRLLGHGGAGAGRSPIAARRAVGRRAAHLARNPTCHRGEPDFVFPGSSGFAGRRSQRTAPRPAFVCQSAGEGRTGPGGSRSSLLRPGCPSAGQDRAQEQRDGLPRRGRGRLWQHPSQPGHEHPDRGARGTRRRPLRARPGWRRHPPLGLLGRDHRGPRDARSRCLVLQPVWLQPSDDLERQARRPVAVQRRRDRRLQQPGRGRVRQLRPRVRRLRW